VAAVEEKIDKAPPAAAEEEETDKPAAAEEEEIDKALPPAAAEEKIEKPAAAEEEEIDKAPPAAAEENIDKPAATPQAEVEEEKIDEFAEDHNRRIAMEMKCRMQDASAVKETQRRGEAMIADGLGVGAVVTVKVDYRTFSHAQGLVCIVYKYTETGSAIVCCESGVLTHDGSSKDYYVPSDKFKVNAGVGESAVIPKKLEKVREDIIKGVYDYEKMPRISYSKFHQECIEANSPCKRNVCGCKGVCSARCGCRRKGFDCTSTCGCSGNCNWRNAK
jgi:hypothetical protein